MIICGYRRVLTADQNLPIQRELLKTAGSEVIGEEAWHQPQSRAELETLMDFMKKGNTLVVTRIDRLARSIRGFQNIVHELKDKGITLKTAEQLINTRIAAGKAFLGYAGSICRV